MARTVLAVLEREVDSGEMLKLVLPLLVEHRQHVGARAREDEPGAADVAPRLEEHGDRGRVDGGAAVKVEQEEAEGLSTAERTEGHQRVCTADSDNRTGHQRVTPTPSPPRPSLQCSPFQGHRCSVGAIGILRLVELERHEKLIRLEQPPGGQLLHDIKLWVLEDLGALVVSLLRLRPQALQYTREKERERPSVGRVSDCIYER